eukprot:2519384-Prymnesium_polylepis.1
MKSRMKSRMKSDTTHLAWDLGAGRDDVQSDHSVRRHAVSLEHKRPVGAARDAAHTQRVQDWCRSARCDASSSGPGRRD